MTSKKIGILVGNDQGSIIFRELPHLSSPRRVVFDVSQQRILSVVAINGAINIQALKYEGYVKRL